jgi:hypothetical protein
VVLTRVATLALCAALAACATAPRLSREALERGIDDQLAATQALAADLAAFKAASGTPSRGGSIDGSYYNIARVKLPPLDPSFELSVPAMLRSALQESGVKHFEYLSPNGPQQFDAPFDSESFEGVPLAVEYAAALGAQSTFRGAESDLRVHFTDGSAHLVTVWNEGGDLVEASEGAGSLPEVASGAPPAEQIRARYGVGPLEGWSPSELASLDQALATLDPRELAVISGLPFKRRADAPANTPKPPPGLLPPGSKACGMYHWEDGRRWIDIFDCAFESESSGFVGSADRPFRPSVQVIVHEIGHAVAKKPTADLFDRVLQNNADIKVVTDEFKCQARSFPAQEMSRFQKMKAKLELIARTKNEWAPELQGRMASESPILRDFDRVRGTIGFTSYGRWNSDEAFAEAFSLYRVDPDACRRISPEAFAFFASGRHIPVSP